VRPTIRQDRSRFDRDALIANAAATGQNRLILCYSLDAAGRNSMPTITLMWAVILLSLATAVRAADPAVDFSSAQGKYRAGDLNGALQQLEPLLTKNDLDQTLKQRARELAAGILHARGEAHFRQVQIAKSIADFDRQIQLQPDQEAHHWQRGIAYYYAGEYEKGARQFEHHRTVNPQDVENAAWHFLCAARSPNGSSEKARKTLIPVADDSRVPMAQIQQMFAGTMTSDEVLKAGQATGGAAKFYADLYVGLYHEALGQTDESLRHIRLAADNSSAKGSYMHDVAVVHVALRAAGAAQQGNLHPETVDEAPDITESDPRGAAAKEALLLSGARQLLFEGRRAGEGYFSKDGSLLVFQSERDPGNPFFQIYLMNRATGDIERVSPGHGKTTCAWIHPDGDKVLFASTHDDQAAAEKQRSEIEQRQSGKERRYSWDYDEYFELYEFDRKSQQYRKLTNARGYDAEGSWSPDGKLIAFASNRRAYEDKTTEAEKKQFELDPATLNDIYVMDADGKNVRRLTTEPGYDGGPFFSPDGGRLCWRHFSPDGAVAEIWTMNIDGTDKCQITHLDAMSWAPYYHPSGQYLVFTTNRHGFGNFELYLIDAEGKSTPVRVSYSKGFDGLPAFTPDGNGLAWTSSRTASGQSQLFLASWNHERARELLELDMPAENPAKPSADSVKATVNEDEAALALDASAFADLAHQRADPDYATGDIGRHVKYLCRDELEGRFTGSRGERMATAYVAAYMEKLGLKPAGDDGAWFQPFEFTSGVDLGANNALTGNGKSYQVDKDWRPLSFSGTGEVKSAPLVFAGYGIVFEGGKQQETYDSYAHLDVKDKWVVVFRYLPEDITPERRQQLNRPSQLRFKTSFARERGARGLIVVTGPHAETRSELVPLQLDGILAGSSLPVISVTNEVADLWLRASGKSLKQLQGELDNGEQKMGFVVNGIELAANIDVQRIKKSGRNVLGRLRAADVSEQEIIVGAHIDHLGKGASSSSLARDDEETKIHYGADDNASGVAALLEIAESLADQHRRGQLRLRRDIVFAAWSGEELGLLGSDHFVKAFSERDNTVKASSASNPGQTAERPIYPAVAAYLNMDMVGRLETHLILQGVGSSSIWRGEVERRNAPVGLPITLQDDSYLPTDASSFYLRGVPILSAFTGAHSDYHTPRDTPEKLNYEGAAQIARFMGLVAAGLATSESTPDYVQQTVKDTTTGGRLRAYLGTIPDYAEEVTGVILSGVSKGSPSEKAGIKPRDVIVELAGKKIENIYDYTHAIEGLKIGEPVKIVVLRKDKRVELKVTPAPRD
jgi:Tol biopolymer transport system component/lipoprotein NlpI